MHKDLTARRGQPTVRHYVVFRCWPGRLRFEGLSLPCWRKNKPKLTVNGLPLVLSAVGGERGELRLFVLYVR